MTTTNPQYIEGNGFVAEVIRTNRKKTASVRVHEGEVSVVIPKNLPPHRIEELINKKTPWINTKLQLQSEASPFNPKEYINGECFTYLGKNYRLKLESDTSKSVKLKDGGLIVTLPHNSKSTGNIKNIIQGWYKVHAEQKLIEKVERYAKIIGVTPSSINVKTFKARWGSCSIRGTIQFNWKIIMAPNRIVDYVVIHELCHIKQHNHSPKFWKLVEKIIPDYKEDKEWLKKYGGGLDI